MSHLIRFLVFLAIAVLVAGCKVAVIVVEGGEVESIGSTTCAEGTICIVEVIDTDFSESFTAVPNPGWHFVKWNSGEGFFCGDSTDPTCVLSTVGTAGIEAIIASDQTFYIMPIFKFGPDTVTVDGKEWLQPAEFLGYTYDQIKIVCPAGNCFGSLPGSAFDLTGYTWASVDEVSALFNAYGLDPPFTGLFQERYNDEQVNADIALDFAVTATECYGDCPVGFLFVAGMVRDPAPAGQPLYTPYFLYLDEYNPPDPVNLYFNNTNFFAPSAARTDGIGVWFWR